MCILISTEKEYQNKINNDPNKKNWWTGEEAGQFDSLWSNPV